MNSVLDSVAELEFKYKLMAIRSRRNSAKELEDKAAIANFSLSVSQQGVNWILIMKTGKEASQFIGLQR